MTKFHLGCVAAVMLAACGDGNGRDTQWSLFSKEQEQIDQGTELSADAAVLGTSCDTGEGVATIGGAVTTTGSVDSAQILASIDDGAVEVVGEIPPQAFVGDGRVKTAEYAVTLPTGAGTHTVKMCFLQSGSQGREPKSACAAELTVTVVCDDCDEVVEPFGDVVTNQSLCKGNGPPKLPVHVRGQLGGEASLTIAGPNGYSHEATLRRAGDSCNYHYVWDTAGNGGAGRYAFVVTGNGQTVEFGADLHCR